MQLAEMSSEHTASEHYQVYLLRLWRESTDAPWRLALREASDGTMIGFTDLDELVIFLLRQMGSSIEREVLEEAIR